MMKLRWSEIPTSKISLFLKYLFLFAVDANVGSKTRNRLRSLSNSEGKISSLNKFVKLASQLT